MRGRHCAASFGRRSHPGRWRLAQRWARSHWVPAGRLPLRCVHKSREDASSLKMGLRLPPARPFLGEPFGVCAGCPLGLSPRFGCWPREVMVPFGLSLLGLPQWDTRDPGVNSRGELLTVPEAGSPGSKCRQGGLPPPFPARPHVALPPCTRPWCPPLPARFLSCWVRAQPRDCI